MYFTDKNDQAIPLFIDANILSINFVYLSPYILRNTLYSY